MKYVLVIPDGVGIRNFLCTDFIDLLLEDGAVVVWHALPEASLAPFEARWGAAVRFVRLPECRDGLPERVLRKARTIAQVRWQRGPGSDEVLWQLRPRGDWKGRLVGRAAHVIARLAAGPDRLQGLDRLHDRATDRADYLPPFEAFLRKETPDVVFCAHQRAFRAVPALRAAQRLGIPAATFIYSWDNLPKNRNAVSADAFFVWSEHMRDEVLRLYPAMTPDQVVVTGTPQFEHYFNPDLVAPRRAFLEGLGLDPARPVVCFSGDDVTTSPHDPFYLRDLAEGVRGLPRDERPQILFRRCPVDTSDRYAPVLAQYPEIVVSDPAWHFERHGSWSEAVPTMADVRLLVNVVTHCDLVVNLGSTMGMDFAILNKPAIFVNYDPVPPAQVVQSVRHIYRLPHFETVHALQPVYWAEGAEHLAELVRHALRHPEEKKAARQAWLALLVAAPLAEASRRCAAALRRLAAGTEVPATPQTEAA